MRDQSGPAAITRCTVLSHNSPGRNPEGDDRVLEGRRSDHEGVKELVVSEHRRRRVGASEGVDHGSQCVETAAEAEQRQPRRPRGPPRAAAPPRRRSIQVRRTARTAPTPARASTGRLKATPSPAPAHTATRGIASAMGPWSTSAANGV